ncbi:MAG: alkaline phosphatase family protein [Alcaligenaceae bacterium]
MKLILKSTFLLFTLLLQQTAAQTAAPQGSPLVRPNKNLVILVSIDGFRNDYLERGITPNLLALAQKGTFAKKFEPVFPTITFPNHYSLVTGRYPDRNGIVNNTMYDPAKTDQVFRLSDRNAIENPLWWEEGTPLWVTLKKQGKRSSTLFWVGSESPNQGIQPNDWLRYNHSLSSSDRTKHLLSWLNREDQDRADFATLYFSEVDSKGHEFGPNSLEVNASIASADHAIGELLQGLRALGLAEKTTLVVTSDHGMAQITPDRAVDLSAYPSELDSVRIQWTGPLAGFDTNMTDKPILLSRLKHNAHMDCWAKEEVPAKYNFGRHRRVPTVVCLAKAGWSTVASAGQKVIPGQHGHDPSDPAMQGLFIIQGPQIKKTQLETVRNIDVYNLLVRLLNVVGETSDGQDTLYDLVKE